MRTINFILKWTNYWKKIWIKESFWIFLTKLCQYNLSKDIKILCMHYQTWSQQYAEEKNTFLKCTGKQLCQSLFLNKVTGLRPATLKRLYHRCFPANFLKFLNTPILKNIWKGVLLKFYPFELFMIHLWSNQNSDIGY